MDQHINNTNQYYKEIIPILYGHEECKKEHSFGPAVREYFLIYYIVSGKGIFKTGSSTYNLSSGDIFIIRPNEMIYYQADLYNPWTYIWIGFNYNTQSDNCNPCSFLEKDIIHTPTCEYIFKGMLSCENMKMGKDFFLYSRLYELFALLIEYEYQLDSYEISFKYVNEAKNYILSNYLKNITVEEISRYLCIDRRYFYSIFKKHTNQSPKSYIINLKLEKAALLLIHHNYTPLQAAASTGYHDFANFSKMFKKKFGVSPLNYKKMRTLQTSEK